MSMISAQCDELRDAADELQNLIENGHNYTWSGFYSTLRYAQQRLRGAADTIWELRCKLADVVDQQGEIERLKNENARLRELLSQALAAHELDTFFEYFEPHSFWVGWCEDVHELGIEVDDDD